MSRNQVSRSVVGIPLVLCFLIAMLPWLSGCRNTIDTPVFEVRRGPFLRKVTAEGTLKAKETTKITVPPTVTSRVRLAWVAPEGQLLGEGDLVARFDGKEFALDLEDAQADLAGTNQDVVNTQAQRDTKVGEHRRDYEVAELELAFAQRFEATDESLYSGYEIIEDAIDTELATARRNHAGEMSEIQRDLSLTELEILDIEKRKSNIQIEEAEGGLSSLEVRSPHSGLLTLTRNWRGETVKVGSEMWRGQEIGEIPALDIMEAEVFVLEADAGGVSEGKAAIVVVEANPEHLYRAKVARMEAVAKPRLRGVPVQYFGVTLEFEATDTERMKPGQRIVATLVLDELEETIVVPRQAVSQEGDEFWVFKKSGSSFVATPVQAGAGSAALMVIESGLQEGDVIALSKPLDYLEHEAGPPPTTSSAATDNAVGDALEADE